MVLGTMATKRYTRPMASPALLTADDLMRLQPPDKRTGLVRGRRFGREPAGFRHGDIAAHHLRHRRFVRAHRPGPLSPRKRFVLFTNPDTVRAPDVAFVLHDRIPDPMPRGYAPFAPDLTVEVLSPDDRPGEVLAKVADWLKAGTRLVWGVNPDRRLARAYRADGTMAEIGIRLLGGGATWIRMRALRSARLRKRMWDLGGEINCEAIATAILW
jgi:hypothetical protein